jgi:hypothetical protein
MYFKQNKIATMIMKIDFPIIFLSGLFLTGMTLNPAKSK